MERSLILRQIRYLLAIDEHRNFTRAAEALHISQPALSQRIRQLESDLGGQLFDRSGRSVRLTDFGTTYIEFARRAVRDLEAGQRALDDVRNLSRGRLRLAFTPTFTEYLIAPIVDEFYSTYPGIAIEMSEMALEAVESALEEDEVDLAIGFVDVRSDEIEARPLFPERLTLVVAGSHSLTRQRSPVKPDQLAQIPLALLSQKFVSRFYVDSYFAAHALKPTVLLHANSISALLKIVTHGKLATILPDTVQVEHRDLQNVALDPPFPVRTAALLRRRGAYQSVAAAAFEAILDGMLKGGNLSSLLTLAYQESSPGLSGKRVSVAKPLKKTKRSA
jgi:LysR family transcriptional regulator, cyn operon transcriptional activator